MQKWAKAARRSLIAKLGGKCVDCERKRKLEFDHKTPREWRCWQLNSWQRMKRYIEEAERDEIELRCSSCNKRKGEPAGMSERDRKFAEDF